MYGPLRLATVLIEGEAVIHAAIIKKAYNRTRAQDVPSDIAWMLPRHDACRDAREAEDPKRLRCA